MDLRRLLPLLIAILSTLFCQVLSSGVFELSLKKFVNDAGVNSEGNCCTGIRTGNVCRDTCQTFFRICLNHYQSTISQNPKCTFGEVTTPVLGDNSFTLSDNLPVFRNPIQLPFDFTWPGTFTLIIEAWHSEVDSDPSNGSPRELISQISVQRSLEIGEDWKFFTSSTETPHLEYEYRVVCDNNYYGSGCQDLCKPRDDRFGHYICSSNGTMICMEGWTGEYCERAICLEGCHSDHGYCDEPYECRCRMGWQGKMCDQCIPYPGCQHGTCQEEWQCECDEGWGGLFCNQDLNFCTHHHPCRNQATCTNTGEGSYTCECPRGFTGTNCEIEIDDCLYQPCRNNGTCTDIGKGYQCHCPLGFHGRHCESSAKSCSESPCKNGANCSSLPTGYQCQCLPGFTGVNCESQMDECSSQPCKNNGRCIDKNNGYYCVCKPGFSGPQCEEDLNDCSYEPCLNGGTCVDKVNEFECQCQPGFDGPLCQRNIDDCRNWPCANGGTCHDLINDFSCVCAPGFTGKECLSNINECDSNPCLNGGTCTDQVNDFGCTCPPTHYGKRCEGTTGGNSWEAYPPPDSSTPGSNNQGKVTPLAVQDESIITLYQLLLIICLGVGLPIILIIVIILILLLTRRRNRLREAEQKDNVQNEQRSMNNKLSSIDSSIVNSIPPSNVCLKVTNEEQDLSKKTSNTTSKHHNLRSSLHAKDYNKDTLTKNSNAANEALQDSRDLHRNSSVITSSTSNYNQLHRNYIIKPTVEQHNSCPDSSAVDHSEVTSGDVHIEKPINKDPALHSKSSIFFLEKPHHMGTHLPMHYTEDMLATEV